MDAAASFLAWLLIAFAHRICFLSLHHYLSHSLSLALSLTCYANSSIMKKPIQCRKSQTVINFCFLTFHILLFIQLIEAYLKRMNKSNNQNTYPSVVVSSCGSLDRKLHYSWRRRQWLYVAGLFSKHCCSTCSAHADREFVVNFIERLFFVYFQMLVQWIMNFFLSFDSI